MTTETEETIHADPAVEEAAEPNAPARPNTDLSTWYSQEETCKMLGVSPRTLNEKLQRGQLAIEKKKRPVDGRKPEPCFFPADVDREVHKLSAQPALPAVFREETGIGPRQEPAALELLQLVEKLSLRAVEFGQQRQPAIDKGPWLTVETAAAHSGLSEARLRRVVRRMVAAEHPDAILDGALKIRRAAVDAIDAAAMKAADRAEQAATARRPHGIKSVPSAVPGLVAAS
jgi:hypothetical protein